MEREIFFRMRNIDKDYRMGGETVHVLKNISLSVDEGEYLSVLGPSGSGKTTLMNIIGCLDTPTAGGYILRGRAVEEMDETELAALRNREIGFVFQNSQLLPRLSARKNVELPMIYAGVPPRERKKRAEQMLERVGLADRMDHLPSQLSGGQQQRVAVARAGRRMRVRQRRRRRQRMENPEEEQENRNILQALHKDAGRMKNHPPRKNN